ncbi:MAG: protoheme IX farnesyltransferase [Verrucomicrobia bacterium]|nr:protoheme IX farnesyltransferase [Verrucomicrobiota bacterium]
MIKTYFELTKPGILFGNAITAIGGYALASKGSIHIPLLLITLVGLSFIIASACVCNNYKDQKVDAKMARTQNRALVKGLISSKQALIFATILLLLGIITLSIGTNLLTLFVALTGFFLYVVVYSNYKYKSIHGTLIGSLSGGIPPVVGYCALQNTLDGGALLLFTIVALWQMPHFFAIAIYRLQDYVSASIPVYPAKKGILSTKIQMLIYVSAFLLSTLMLTFFHYTGYTYLAVIAPLDLFWLYLCIQGFKTTDTILWARKMFFFSLIIILTLTLLISVDTFL